MTPRDFEQAFSPEATQEQIEAVNRACAEVEEIVISKPHHAWRRCGCDCTSFVSTNPASRYVQNANNSERLIRKAIERSEYGYAASLKITLGINPMDGGSQEEAEIACAPQWARLYAAWKVLKEQER